MYKNLTITAILGAITIVLGAFGAHALKSKLSSEAMQSFETAVRYQMYHILVLLFINTFAGFSIETKNTISYVFFAGITLFSGSIYLIQLAKVPAKSIWYITPLGGLLLIVGWVLLAYHFLKQ